MDRAIAGMQGLVGEPAPETGSQRLESSPTAPARRPGPASRSAPARASAIAPANAPATAPATDQALDARACWITAEHVARWRRPRDVAAPDPVFVVGFPRSGTALLGQLIDAHEALATAPERPLLPGVVEHFTGADRQCLESLDDAQAQALGARYLAELRANLGLASAARAVDVWPLNVLELGVVWRLFPGARVIAAIRDPRDVCLSCVDDPRGLDAALRPARGLADAARAYATVMLAFSRLREVLPIAVHTVRYEDLVREPRAEMLDVLDFLGLDWDEAVAHRHAHVAAGAEAAPGRWTAHAERLAPVLPLLEPHAAVFGYPIASTRRAA